MPIMSNAKKSHTVVLPPELVLLFPVGVGVGLLLLVAGSKKAGLPLLIILNDRSMPPISEDEPVELS